MNRRRRRLLGIAAGLGLLLAFLFWPTGQYLEVPGSAEAVQPFVKVAGQKDTAKGSYMLTTVGVVGPASPAVWLWGKCQPYAEAIPKETLMGDASSAEYAQLQRYYMQSAANNAVAAAFKAAKRPYTIKTNGIYVLSVLKDSPFKAQLRAGDTITKLDGHAYLDADAYVQAIQKRPVGSTLTLTYVRGGTTKHAKGKLMRLPKTQKAGIGITLTEDTRVTTKPKVTIDAGQIGGPSAGLMFTIQTYTQLTGQDLRGGRKIAGTGTITATGQVGQIGGIDKKVYSANKVGATVFFAPDAPATKALLKRDPTYQNNYAVAKRTAKELDSKMTIVPVKTFEDALAYLQQTAPKKAA